MSELINNSYQRKALLKHMILQLHEGEAPEAINRQLEKLLGRVPYGEVVEVEQELISEGLPAEEVLRLCDVHSRALEGQIDTSGAAEIPTGHPVDTFQQENRALEEVLVKLREREQHTNGLQDAEVPDYFIALRTEVNKLTDVDKHYRRKENLLFPFLEKYEITGPPTVMWGKHDETRELLHATVEGLSDPANVKGEEAASFVQLVIEPAASAIEEMIMKEEEILFPMAMDTLTEADWYEIYRQTPEIGFCLYDPKDKWVPEGITPVAQSQVTDTAVQLPSGILEPAELLAILNTLPADLTFVDRNDKVKYFSQGPHRIFDRNRAILNRDVRLCHPPASVHIVEQILEDFKSGRQEKARFWIQMKGKFILIEYYALRGEKNEYLGTVEVSQELSEYRALEGEQRLLNYDAG